jgi:hypothetical protein
MHGRRNMAIILRQPISVARVSHFVAIETRSRNKVHIRGNIQTDIATTMSRCDRFNYCCKKLAAYCNQTNIGGNSAYLLPQFHRVAITTIYCDKLCIRGNIYSVLLQPTTVAIKNKMLQRYSIVNGGPSRGPPGPWLPAIERWIEKILIISFYTNNK